MTIDALRKQVDAITDWLIQTRREFHQHPELGMEEYWTSETIARHLDTLGIPYQSGVAKTGIVGLIAGGKPGKTVALRADMDALPIQEETNLPYASICEGRMHACGHDAHVAILLGVAKILSAIQSDLPGTVKLFFQPAEETDGGAKPMIEAGCMENPAVDFVLGLHVTPYIDTGKIWIKRGKLTASSDTIHITVYGRSSHAAYPEEGIDAIVMAAQVISGLQTIVSRNISPLNSGVLTLGTIQGGFKDNIIADHVRISGTMRTLDPKIRSLMKERIQEVATGICQGMGGQCTVQFEEGYMPIINHDDVVEVIEKNAIALLGRENVLHKEYPSMGVEDFSFFCHKAPGAFFYLGCGNKTEGIVAPGHSPAFRIDENCLKIGVLLQIVHTIALLKKN